MKVGDKVPVMIAGQNVTQAVVKDMTDGVATLECQGFRTQMTYRTELSADPVPKPEPEVDRVMLGLEEKPESPATAETPVAQVETPAPVAAETPTPASAAAEIASAETKGEPHDTSVLD